MGSVSHDGYRAPVFVAMADHAATESDVHAVVPSDDLLAEAEQLIDVLEAHPDPAVGAALRRLLEAVDAVHRTALTHLMGAIQSMAGDAFINRLTGDPAIRLLLMSYNLLAIDRRTLAEEALDAVRGHLHRHGVNTELVDVLGGVVRVRIHGVKPTEALYAGVVKDIQQALATGLPGFQELELHDPGAASAVSPDSAFLPLSSLKRAFRPVYHDVCSVAEMAPGSLRSVHVAGTNVLLARVGDEFHAVLNACGQTPLPLDFSELNGHELTCSWHKCLYDIRTGARLNWPAATRDDWLKVLPVRTSAGVVQVVAGTEPVAAG